jgi:hypothetical protein
MVPFGCGGGGSSSSPTAVPTNASVAVAFIGVPPEGNFRSVSLNISGVRINQTAGASPTSPGWVTIAVPSGVGSGNQQNPGDLAIDLVQNQTMASIFNVAGAPVGAYRTVQVLVDTTLPGTIVPACPSIAANTEGCVNYPMAFSSADSESVIFTLGTPLNLTSNTTTPLLISLAVAILPSGAPVNTGDPYFITVTPTETNVGSFLAAVSGNLTVKGTSTGNASISPLSVSAELTGTNNIIETVPVKKKSAYTLELPAAPSGTSYDIFTSGGGDTFDTAQNLTVVPGQQISDENFAVSGNPVTTFLGTVNDGCTGAGIPGAVLQLLAPAVPTPNPRPTPPAGLCFSNPEQCVVVASASTDQAGFYPLPGTSKNPAPFGQVPTNVSNFAVLVSASGYSSLLSSAYLKSKTNQLCSAGTASMACNFSLTTGYINGTVNLVMDPPPGNSVVVEVFAENHGTNQQVSALSQPVVFKHGVTSQPFTLMVPITGAASSFDLVAVAIDPYLGATSPFPGHEISVLADVPAPGGPCQSVPPIPASPNPTPTPIPLPAMDCVGHGSISGSVQNPDLNTFVEVEKQGVQVLGTLPGLFASENLTNTQYSICVPPDVYQLQRFETAPTAAPLPSSDETPSPTPIPTPVAIGTAQPITVPQPASTSSPCPSSCSNSNTGVAPCPGICNATSASPL